MANSIYTSNESLGINLDDISNDVIVIDTSDNRIGVNILEPHYSIDVRDFSDASGIIYTDYLKTGAIISDLTPDIDVCYNLGTQDKKWNEIHANYLEVSGIKIKDASQFILGSGTGGDAIVFPSDISVNGDISCVNLNVDGITIKDASKFTIGSGTSDTNGIEFMANTTITGDLTITGNINSSYINSLLSGSNEINGYAENVVTDISRGNVFSKYSGTQLLSDFSNQDVGIAATEMVDYFIEVRDVGGTNKYFINGLEKPQLELRKNTEYKFNHIPGIISVIPGVKRANTLHGEGLVYYFTDSSGHYIYVFDRPYYRTWKGLMQSGSIKYDPINNKWKKTYENQGVGSEPRYVNHDTNTGIVSYRINSDDETTNETFTDPYSTYYNEHPFRFYTDSDHTSLYTTGVTYDGSMITITTGSDDITLYYDCSFHHGMGSDAPIILKEKEDYKNFNIKVVDESSLLTYTLDEYNQYDLGDSNVFRLVDSTDSFGISKTGIIVEKTDSNYKIESDVCFNITNYNDFDLCLNVVLTKNNVVLNSAFYNVNSNSVNNIQYNTLERLNLLQNDVLNVKYLLYYKRYNAVTINDLDSLEYNNDTLISYSYSSPTFTRDSQDNDNENPFKDPNDISYNWYGQLITSNYTDIDVDNENELETDIYKSHLDTGPNVNDYSNNDIFKNSNNIKLTDGEDNIDQYYTLLGEKLIVNTDISNLDTYVNIEYIHTNHQISRAGYISYASDDKVKLHQIVFVVKKTGNEETIIDYIKFMQSSHRKNYTTLGGGDGIDHTGETIINNYHIFNMWGPPPSGSRIDENTPLYAQFSHPWTLPFRFNLKNYNLKSGDEITFKSILVFYYFNGDYPESTAVSSFGLNRLYLDFSKGPQGPASGYRIMYYTGTVDYSVNIEIPPQTNKVYTNEIDVNLRSFNISVEKSVDPPPDFNYNITVMNNSVLNNQDIYSKYRATNVLTDFSNQNVGYNPDYNKTFTVVTMGTALKQDPTWVIEVSTEQSGFGKQYMLDNIQNTYWKSGSVGPESVTIDFGQIKTVFGLIINAPETRLTEFTLEKSSDGSNFTTIKQFSGFNQNPDSTSDTVITYTFNLSNFHNTRYIKLNNIMSTGNYAVGISELEFLILDSESTTDVSYIINNEIQPDLSLNIDTPYIFDLTNVSASHPFNIYTDVNSQSLYTGAVIDGSFIYLTIDSATTALYYNCSNHNTMGGVIDIINTGYHNFNVKFIGDTNNIVRSDLLEYNRFDLTSGKFNRNSTSGYANSVDLSGVKVGLYGEYYDIDASLNLTITNTSAYDISLDFVLLQNSVVLYSQTINVDSSLSSQDILITPQLSRLTMFQDDTVNFAFLPYIKVFDNLNRSVNSPLTGELSYIQDQNWTIMVSTEQSGFGKQNMLDDDPYTYWKSGSVGPESVTIDFGQIKTVFGLIINAPETRLTEFTLEKSSDGSNFTTIKQFSGFNQNPDSTSDTVITYTFNLSNVHNTRYIKLSNIMSTGNYAVGISELKFLILDTTSNNYLTNTNLQQIYLDINVNSFNLVVSAPDYEELEVGNLLTANNIDVSNIDVSNIDIKNTLTIASETPTTAGDSLVFDGNKLTWKNAIIDVREYIKNTDITQRGNNAISGITSTDYLGSSCAMSADGNRIIVGGGGAYYMNKDSYGRVQVLDFNHSTNNWDLKFDYNVPTTNYGNYGTSVDITPDGNTIIFGAWHKAVVAPGMAWVYDLSTNGIWYERYEFRENSLHDGSGFGSSVSISSDGNIVACGAARYDTKRGIVYIYEYNGISYINTDIINAQAINSHFGESLKLNNDGNILVIGEPFNNTDNGKGYIYRKNTNNTSWSLDFSIQGSNSSRLGHNVTISADGKVAAFGIMSADNNATNEGAIAIYRYYNSVWNNITPNGHNGYFWTSDHGGSSQAGAYVGFYGLSLSYNGDILAVGIPFYDQNGSDSGIVEIYNWNNSAYDFVKRIEGQFVGGLFGTSTAISDNRKYITVGELYNNGRVYVYDLKIVSINSGELYYNSSDYVLRIMP